VIKIIKKILRDILKYFCQHFLVRGRHRLVSSAGEWLSSENTETIIINGIPFPIDHKDKVQRHIYYGLYESEFIAHLRKTLKNNDIFIDCGANLGYISDVASGFVGKSGKVYAIEPSEVCYTRISKNLLQNSFDNIVLINAALSNKPGEALFYDTPNVISRGYACLAGVEQPEGGIGYLIKTITIDGLCLENKVDSVRYLKLDIEGAELMALEGAQKMLSDKKIEYILAETLFSQNMREQNLKMYRMLITFGYQPFKPDKYGNLKSIDYLNLRDNRFDVIWR
jgi:FkbM family methyltransferase